MNYRLPLKMLALAIIGVAFMGISAKPAHSELPPLAYEDMKQEASDVLEIKVVRVARNTRDGENMRDVSIFADAIVTAVSRSKSGVKVGDRIQLRYMTFENPAPGWVGPSPALQVEEEGAYQAWLKKSGSFFYAAARGQSFQKK